MKKTKKELKNSRQPFEALVAAKEVIKNGNASREIKKQKQVSSF